MNRPIKNITQFTRTFAGMLPLIYRQPAHDVEATDVEHQLNLAAKSVGFQRDMDDAMTKDQP